MDPTIVRYIDLVEASHSHPHPVLGIGLGRELRREASWSSVRPNQRVAKQPKMRVRAPGSSHRRHHQLSCHRMRVSAGAQQISGERRAVLSHKLALGDVRLLAPPSAKVFHDCVPASVNVGGQPRRPRRGGGRWLAGGQMTSRSGKKKPKCRKPMSS